MEDVFGVGGAVAQVLLGHEPRRSRPSSPAVADALGRASTCLPKREARTGKSLAYLVPALESGCRVVVATATKALQEQLLTKDVPIAAALGAR